MGLDRELLLVLACSEARCFLFDFVKQTGHDGYGEVRKGAFGFFESIDCYLYLWCCAAVNDAIGSSTSTKAALRGY